MTREKQKGFVSDLNYKVSLVKHSHISGNIMYELSTVYQGTEKNNPKTLTKITFTHRYCG